MPTVQTAPASLPPTLASPLTLEPLAFGPKSVFLQSSQARHWMYSAAQLDESRHSANREAVRALQEVAAAVRAVCGGHV